MRQQLRLFVAGHSEVSLAAIRNVREICQSEQGRMFKVEIVDVLQAPEVAAEYGIIATPTLLRIEPKPYLRLIGNLSYREQVLEALTSPPVDSQTQRSKQKAVDFLFDQS